MAHVHVPKETARSLVQVNKRFATIPKGRGDIPKGTLAAILRDLGFTMEDLTKR